MSQNRFVKGDRYTRAAIAEEIGLPAHRRVGGNWNTGYDTYKDEVFVFCNVGIPGRTGHDYANEWVGQELVWYGKTGTHRNQPLMKKMTAGGMPVHIFWRSKDSDPFTYAGEGRAVEVADTSPVRIRWSLR